MTAETVGARPGIATIEGLREHLQWAIELEHATLPPYLCALYSLDPGRNPDAFAVLSGVFAEEMLHLALVANILNAVGGRPLLDSPTLLPAHPRRMPHGDRSLELSLLPFGPEALEMFLRIEQPARPESVSEADDYETIRQFYDAIKEGLLDLCGRLGEDAVFCGDPERQVRDVHFRSSAGRLVAVDGLSSALAALDEIVEQGEGSSRDTVWDGDADPLQPGAEEVAHYYRLHELQVGRRYRAGDTPESGPTGDVIVVDPDGVLPMRHNPRLPDHPVGHPIRVAQEKFNVAYSILLGELDQAFNGSPSMLGGAVGTMFSVKSQALALLQLPDEESGGTAGPTFDYVRLEDRSTIASRNGSMPASGGGR